MFFSAELVAQLAQERIEREIATAELLRQGRQPSPTFRQAVGRRVIRLGAVEDRADSPTWRSP